MDKRIYIAKPLFSNNLYLKYKVFINLCYLTHQGIGQYTKLRVTKVEKEQNTVLKAHVYIAKQDFSKAEEILQQPVTLLTKVKDKLIEIVQMCKQGFDIGNKFKELFNLETEMIMAY
ncbi:MAG TPA: hypothetical protein ENK59_04050 [Thioploca sp.]|nr:hypothetical protein [Thioploca sp.]